MREGTLDIVLAILCGVIVPCTLPFAIIYSAYIIKKIIDEFGRR